MTYILQFIKKLLAPAMTAEERYYAKSTDLVDLEHRIARVMRGDVIL